MTEPVQVGDGFEIKPPKPRLSTLDQINVRRLLIHNQRWDQQLRGKKGPTFFDSGVVYAPHVPEALLGTMLTSA